MEFFLDQFSGSFFTAHLTSQTAPVCRRTVVEKHCSKPPACHTDTVAVQTISFWPLWLYLQIIKHVLGLWRTHSWSSHPCHWFETSHTVLRGVEGGKGALPATTLRHHILLTIEREKLHLHTLHSRWPPNNVRQDALQRETKRWRQTSTAHKNHKVRRLDAPRWSATRFQEHKRYIIVFITIIVIFHFIFAQKKQTNNTFQGLDRPPPNPQTHHYSYSLLKTQLKSM